VVRSDKVGQRIMQRDFSDAVAWRYLMALVCIRIAIPWHSVQRLADIRCVAQR